MPRGQRVQRILIAGSYGQGNTGDEAILSGLLELLRPRLPGAGIRAVSGNPDATRAQHGIEALPWDDWAALAGAVEESDVLILGGGGIFFDYTGFDPGLLLENAAPDLAHYASFPLLAWLLRKPLAIHACGVGPLLTPLGREAVRLAFATAAWATVRDAESRELLGEIGADVSRVEVAADPAFALQAALPEQAQAFLEGQGVPSGRPLIALTSRPWNLAGPQKDWEGRLARALAAFAVARDARVLLLPFHEGHDEDSLGRIGAGLQAGGMAARDVIAFRGPASPQEIAGILGLCDLTVGLRLHSILLSMHAGTPAVALSYDPKVRSLMRLARHEDLCFDLKDLSGIEAALADAWSRREKLRRDFLRVSRGQKSLAEESAGRLAALVSQGRLEAHRLDGADAAAFLRFTGPAVAGRLRDIRARDEVIRERGVLIERQWTELRQAGEWLENQKKEVQVWQREADRQVEEARRSRLEAERQRQEAERQRQEAEDQRRQAEDQRRQAEHQRREAEDQRRLAEDQRRLAEKSLAELTARTGERDEAHASLQSLREQRDLMLRERNDLARRLGELEATVAYRAVSRFWALMRHTLPEGSRRRALYRGGRTVVARLLGVKAGAAPPGFATAAEETPAAGGPDPRGDLLRFEEQVRASGAGTVAVILSATQLVESEGQRPTHFALELARRGIPVVFCYWRWWPHEWCAQDRMEEGIVQIPIDVALARPDVLAGAFAGFPSRIAFFEFPYPGFFEILAAFNAEGWVTLYDVLDDWEEFHRVGQAVWYDEPFERHLITAADAVFAINEPLACRIRELGGEGVGVVGNGLKPGLEVVREEKPLDRGEVTVGYFGYLAGAWFDWDLVAEAARRRPAWRFYLIGYGGSPEGIELPENVALLGKKPQGELAAFAANWDVAIIPFKPDRLAAGADPIKTYEYLAMGLPVVATGVYPPSGGEAFVIRADGVEDFLDALARAAGDNEEGRQSRREYAASCTWGDRLDALLNAVESCGQRVAEKRALAGWAGGRG